MKLLSLALSTLAVSILASCASSHGGSSDDVKPAAAADVPDELSLKADRSALDEERKNVPEDKKKENDELAGILQMVQAKPNQEPSEVRDRFSKAVRDRRDKNDRNLRKRREDFEKNERKTREAFLKQLKDERDKYSGGKHTSDERKEFFDSQEDRRKDFFSNASDARHDFDSKLNEDRKAFDDYVKEKSDAFNQDMREYTTGFYERKKQEALAKDMKTKAKEKEAREKQAAEGLAREASEPSVRSGQSDERDEFSTIPKGPSIPLGPPGDNQ